MSPSHYLCFLALLGVGDLNKSPHTSWLPWYLFIHETVTCWPLMCTPSAGLRINPCCAFQGNEQLLCKFPTCCMACSNVHDDILSHVPPPPAHTPCSTEGGGADPRSPEQAPTHPTLMRWLRTNIRATTFVRESKIERNNPLYDFVVMWLPVYYYSNHEFCDSVLSSLIHTCWVLSSKMLTQWNVNIQFVKYYSGTTNKGHFGTCHFILCWEVVLFLEVKSTVIQKNVLCWEAVPSSCRGPLLEAPL